MMKLAFLSASVTGDLSSLIEISKSLISKLQFESLINILEKCNYKIIMFKYFKFSPKILKFDPRNLGIDYFFIHKNYKKKN